MFIFGCYILKECIRIEECLEKIIIGIFVIKFRIRGKFILLDFY